MRHPSSLAQQSDICRGLKKGYDLFFGPFFRNRFERCDSRRAFAPAAGGSMASSALMSPRERCRSPAPKRMRPAAPTKSASVFTANAGAGRELLGFIRHRSLARDSGSCTVSTVLRDAGDAGAGDFAITQRSAHPMQLSARVLDPSAMGHFRQLSDHCSCAAARFSDTVHTVVLARNE